MKFIPHLSLDRPKVAQEIILKEAYKKPIFGNGQETTHKKAEVGSCLYVYSMIMCIQHDFVHIHVSM